MKTLARFPRSTFEPPPRIDSTPSPVAPAVLRKPEAGRRRPRAGWRSITVLAILAAAVWVTNWWIDPAGHEIARQLDEQASERIASTPDAAGSTR
jgi:hypothetical protein